MTVCETDKLVSSLNEFGMVYSCAPSWSVVYNSPLPCKQTTRHVKVVPETTSDIS